jgi:hypothetical protein
MSLIKKVSSIIAMSRNRLTCVVNGCKEEEVKVVAKTSVIEKMVQLHPVPRKPIVNRAIKMMMPHQSIITATNGAAVPNKSVKMMMSCIRSSVKKNETIDSPHHVNKMASSHQSIPFINGAVSPDDSSTKMKTPRSSSADNRAVSPDSVKILLLHHSSSPVSADASSAMTRMRGNTTNTLWWWKGGGGGGGVVTQMSRASPFERDPYSIWEMGKVADSKSHVILLPTTEQPTK